MEETTGYQASGAQITTFIPVKKRRSPTTRPCFLQRRSSSIQLLCPPDYNNYDKQLSDLDLGLPKMRFNYLPEGLLLEILLRLPVKAIFRFKCVSRHWLYLISDPSFYRSYVEHQHKLCFRILYKYLYVPKFQDIFDRLRLDEYASPPLLFLSCFQEQIHAEQFKILSVSNGLVLCGSLGPFIYYVCSPVTRQWVSLPLSNRSAIHFGEGIVSRVNPQQNVVTSYKVVRARWLDYESNFLNLETFSSERGEWTDHRLFCPQRFRLIRRGGGPINYKGVLHWFVYDHGLIAFDPYNNSKRCELIRLPEDRDVDNEFIHDGLYRLCDECRGELRYFEVAPEASGQSYCFSLWVLKNYENPNQREWCLLFRVRRSDVWSNDDANISHCLSLARLVPLAFDPFNQDVVYLRCVTGGSVISYHFQTKRLEVCCDNIGTAPDLSWRTVISFLLPMWPTPVPHFSRKAIKRS